MKIQDFSITPRVKEIVIGNEKISVKQYLPSKDKIDLIDGVVDLLAQRGDLVTNPAYANSIFNGYLIMYYSDLEFDFVDSGVAIEVYDYFESNGYLETFVAAIPKTEYSSLFDFISESIVEFNKYRQSASLVADRFILALPDLMERIRDISENIKR